MSSHHFPRTHSTLAHCALPIDLTFFSLPMMPFKNGKKINSYKHSIKLKIIFVFPWYKLQREIGGLSNQRVGGEEPYSQLYFQLHPSPGSDIKYFQQHSRSSSSNLIDFVDRRKTVCSSPKVVWSFFIATKSGHKHGWSCTMSSSTNKGRELPLERPLSQWVKSFVPAPAAKPPTNINIKHTNCLQTRSEILELEQLMIAAPKALHLNL
jgi:hypothetical protein